MSKSFTLGFTTNGTCLSCVAVCICPIVSKSFALSSTTELTCLSCITICVYPYMSASCIYNVYSIKDLIANVLVTSSAYVCNRRIIKVSKYKFYERSFVSISGEYRFSIGNININYVLIYKCISKCLSRHCINNVCIQFAKVNAECLNTGKCIIVTKENDSCLRVDCVYKRYCLSIVLRELCSTVHIGLAHKYESICYGDLNLADCVITEHVINIFLIKALDVICSLAEHINVSVEEIKNANLIGICLRNACFKNSFLYFCASFVYVSYVFFTYESRPVHFNNGSITEVFSRVVIDSAIENSLKCSNEGIYHFVRRRRFELLEELSKCLYSVLVKRRSEIAIYVSRHITTELIHCECAKLILVIADRNKICLLNCIEGNSIPAVNCKLCIKIKLKCACEKRCESRIVSDSEIVRIFRNIIVSCKSLVYNRLKCLSKMTCMDSKLISKFVAALNQEVNKYVGIIDYPVIDILTCSRNLCSDYSSELLE